MYKVTDKCFPFLVVEDQSKLVVAIFSPTVWNFCAIGIASSLLWVHYVLLEH